MSKGIDVGNSFQEAFLKTIPQGLVVVHPVCHLPHGRLGRHTHSHDGRHVFRSRPAALFLDASIQKGLNPDALAHVEGGRPLGPVEGIGSQAQEVDLQGLHVYRNVACSGHSICMEKNPLLPCDSPDFRDGLQGPHFVVAVHHRDENRLGGDRLLDLLRVNTAVLVNGKLRDLKTHLLQRPDRMHDGEVLYRRDENVSTPFLVGEGNPLEGEVVCLGPAGGEDDLVRVPGVNQPRRLPTRLLDRLLTSLPEGVHARWITKILFQEGEHGLHDLGQKRGGVDMIKIDALISFHFRILSIL